MFPYLALRLRGDNCLYLKTESPWKPHGSSYGCWYILLPLNEARVAILSDQFALQISKHKRTKITFLVHLSWKLKWAYLIAFRPSSVCLKPPGHFNQTFYKVSMGRWQMKGHAFYQGEIITKKRLKVFSTTTGPLSTKIWHQASLDEVDLRFYK